MLNQILAMAPVFQGLYTMILGVAVVFLGIALIVLCVAIAGKFFNKPQTPKIKKLKEEKKEVIEVKAQDEQLPAHVKVAIVAAISAYYFNQEPQTKCDFVVKKIKRI
jgi:sodium pump decarboxylase gamma subunit